MDTKTGEIRPMKDFPESAKDRLVPIDLENLSDKAREELESRGVTYASPRSRCPCGSGKRLKSCCLGRTDWEPILKYR